MNDRIRELAKQAYIADSSRIPHWKFTQNSEDLLRSLEGFNKEFAELVVREAHEVIVVGGVDDVDYVLKHFGVEK